MYSHITIGNFVLENQVHSVKIQSSRKSMGDKATIEIANLEARLESEIKYGSPVTIRLGYDEELYTEFTGYVSSVSPKIPLIIECEDEMYQLKRQSVEPKSWRSVKLKDLINYIVPGANIDTYDITLSPFRIEKTIVNKAEAMQKLKDEFGLDVYYRDKQLYVGLAYKEDMGIVYHHFQKNAIMDSLIYKRKEDLKILIKAISINQKNEKTEIEVGDKNGETHTLHFYNKTKTELEQLAKEKLELMKYDGYRGKFKAFGQPVVKHGMIEDLADDKYTERAGRYFVDSVETTYDGSGGFKRNIELGRKAI